MNFNRKKIRTLLLICMVLTMLSTLPAYAEEAIKVGDILCFGTPDDECGFDGRWLVLDNTSTNDGKPGMFLTSLSLIGDETGEELLFRNIGDVSVNFLDRGEEFAKAHPGSQTYQGSEIQLWCKAFLDTHFSDAEKDAILPTFKSDEASVIPGLGIPLPGAIHGTVDFDPVENILDGDRIFLLSAEEAYNSDYGFVDNRSRVALYKGTPAGYWLRSPHIDTFPLDVGFVFSFGTLMDYPVNGQFLFHMTSCARPAMNIDSTKISSLEPLATENGVTVWRVSFQEESNLNSYSTILPVVGEVIDLRGMAQKAFATMVVILFLLIALIVFLIVRHKRRKTAGKHKSVK